MRSLGRAKFLVCLATLWAVTCGSEHRMWKPYYSFGRDYLLYARQVERRSGDTSRALKFSERGIETVISDAGVDTIASAQLASFWFELTNKTNKSVYVLWPEVRYIDEKGETHEVYWRRRSLPLDPRKIDAATPTVLQPNQTFKPTV